MFASAVSLSSLLAQAAATPAAGQPPAPSPIVSFMPMIFIGIIFYFILIRPQQKRAKEQAALVSAVRSGDEIVTSGGLHGIVTNAREAGSRTVLVKFGDSVKIEVDRSAIATVIKPDNDDDARAAVPAVKTS